ncbi:O-antigen ligase family protein [Shewanella sp. 10N.286.45.A1]|uniref:O-antigen ligase family protein n=1 Tax=Shewanella sp. 10N.286.45.A1 TaxID=3229694 RepID=UPI00354B06BA
MIAAFTCLFLLGTVFAINLIHTVNIDNEYDLKRFIVVGFISFFSLFLLTIKEVQLIKISTLSKTILCGFICLAVYSALVSKHPYWGMVEIANISLFIVGFYLFSACIRTIEQHKLLCGVYTFSLLFSILTFCKYILFLFFSYFDAQSFNIHGLLSGYVNVRFFNQLQVMLVPLLFLPLVLPALAKFKRISLAFIALHWLALLQTEARGAALSLIIALVIIAIFLPREMRNRLGITSLKAMLFGIVLWFVLIYLIPYCLMDAVSFQIRTSSSGRIDLWLYVLQAIPEQPWTGFGPMSFAWAEGKPIINAHPHNSVMQLLYEYGVIACVAIVVWAMSGVYRHLSSLKVAASTQSMPVTYAVLSALIYSLFSGVIVMPMAQLLLIFLLAVQVQFCGCNFYKLEIRVRVLLIAAVTVSLSMLLLTYQSEELLPALLPRVWVNGLIGY